MKKYIIALTLLASASFGLEAKRNSWSTVYCKIQPGYSNLRLNYSGSEPYRVQLNRMKSYSRDGSTLIANNASVNTFSFGINAGISHEISESFGLMGEVGMSLYRASQFLNNADAVVYRPNVAVGMFYFQPSFRIYALAGLGFGPDIFGYPNAVADLEKGEKVYVEVGKELINSSMGLSYRGAVGFDYKLTDMFLVGLEYSYTRSATTANLENNHSFYVSSHSVAVNIGLYM